MCNVPGRRERDRRRGDIRGHTKHTNMANLAVQDLKTLVRGVFVHVEACLHHERRVWVWEACVHVNGWRVCLCVIFFSLSLHVLSILPSAECKFRLSKYCD